MINRKIKLLKWKIWYWNFPSNHIIWFLISSSKFSIFWKVISLKFEFKSLNSKFIINFFVIFLFWKMAIVHCERFDFFFVPIFYYNINSWSEIESLSEVKPLESRTSLKWDQSTAIILQWKHYYWMPKNSRNYYLLQKKNITMIEVIHKLGSIILPAIWHLCIEWNRKNHLVLYNLQILTLSTTLSTNRLMIFWKMLFLLTNNGISGNSLFYSLKKTAIT